MTQEIIKELSKNLGEPKWLLDRRLAACDVDVNLGLQPYGIGIAADYAPLRLDEQDFSVSGVRVAAQGAQVRHFDSAAKNAADARLLREQMATTGTVFARRALALFTDGFVVRVPQDAPEVVELVVSQEVAYAHTYLMIVVEKGARVTMLESIDAHTVHNVVIDIVVQEGAHLEYIPVQNIGMEAHSFVQRRVMIERDAQAHIIDMQLGGKSSLSYTTQELNAPGAQGTIKGVFLARDHQLIDINTVSHHRAPDTSSDILVKGVVGGHAHGVYRGLVKIDAPAVRSTGYQQQDTLLLSADAEIDAVPDLEIATNEVRCSHGVTTTRINAEKLFYAQSRGIDVADARQMFVRSHYAPVLAAIAHDETREQISALIETTLHNSSAVV